MHFNPRSREGSDCISSFTAHSLADFNPRSREGSDQLPQDISVQTEDFNPRSREGSDCLVKCIKGYGKISIHAPAKGATKNDDGVPLLYADFNPRSREGSDLQQGCGTLRTWGFQSTLPRRERHITGRRLPAERDFNPRSREGSDRFPWWYFLSHKISIHAPAKGATAFINIFSLAVRLFFISSHQ